MSSILIASVMFLDLYERKFWNKVIVVYDLFGKVGMRCVM